MAAKKTKKQEEAKAKRQVIMVTTDDGREIRRTEYIRELWDNGNGMKIGEIAKKLGVKYQIVWQTINNYRKSQAKKAEKAAAEAETPVDPEAQVTNYDEEAEDEF